MPAGRPRGGLAPASAVLSTRLSPSSQSPGEVEEVDCQLCSCTCLIQSSLQPSQWCLELIMSQKIEIYDAFIMLSGSR